MGHKGKNELNKRQTKRIIYPPSSFDWCVTVLKVEGFGLLRHSIIHGGLGGKSYLELAHEEAFKV